MEPDAEERRSELRKAARRSKHPMNRGSLNGETRLEQSSHSEWRGYPVK